MSFFHNQIQLFIMKEKNKLRIYLPLMTYPASGGLFVIFVGFTHVLLCKYRDGRVKCIDFFNDQRVCYDKSTLIKKKGNVWSSFKKKLSQITQILIYKFLKFQMFLNTVLVKQNS